MYYMTCYELNSMKITIKAQALFGGTKKSTKGLNGLYTCASWPSRKGLGNLFIFS